MVTIRMKRRSWLSRRMRQHGPQDGQHVHEWDERGEDS